MRAILEDIKTGEIGVFEVPPPELRAGGVLVSTAFSAISAGTERATVELAKKSLVQKAMARPDLVRQVLDYARVNGIKAAYEKVQGKLNSLKALGYSCAGTVLAVADDVQEFRVGDRVACAGAGYANHAEINFIPTNLLVRVPDNVGLDEAALSTIGAIAMQGVRQAEPNIGETVLVIGAGLIGVLTIQVARSAGCRVIAVDRNPMRVNRALELGAHAAYLSDCPDLAAKVCEFSRYGPDIAILTAATPSAEPITLAAKLLRDRGRIVVVGDVGINVPRENMYLKELSVVMSRSYGPGRYDSTYEEGGIDYPVGYVRWTERRNMEAFLDLASAGALNLKPLLERRYATDQGPIGFEAIRESSSYTAVIEYDSSAMDRIHTPAHTAAAAPLVSDGTVRVGCIGAGAFASGVIFPKLRATPGVFLSAVATASGAAAESARRAFQFTSTATPSELLARKDIDAVFVMTQHDSHARYACSALVGGKPVFVEKPLATTREELCQVRDAYAQSSASSTQPFLMVGFNRRFAPASEQIKQFFDGRLEPMMIQIRVNAGYLPLTHWVHHHGGRIVGEVCHFVDWARFLVGVPIDSVVALSLPNGARYSCDNAAALLRFRDGSIASIVYLANGNRVVPKEQFEVFCAGAVAQLNDFVHLELSRNGKSRRSKLNHDKGHAREIAMTINAIRNHLPSPIPVEEIVEVTDATLAIGESLARGQAIPVGSDANRSPHSALTYSLGTAAGITEEAALNS